VQDMNKTDKPIVAGVIGIGVGGLQVPFILFILAMAELEMGEVDTQTCLVIAALSIFAIFAIVGGIYHIRKTKWPLALTGSIAVFFCLNLFNLHRVVTLYYRPSEIYWPDIVLPLLGIIVIVLTVLSRKEFK